MAKATGKFSVGDLVVTSRRYEERLAAYEDGGRVKPAAYKDLGIGILMEVAGIDDGDFWPVVTDYSGDAEYDYEWTAYPFDEDELVKVDKTP